MPTDIIINTIITKNIIKKRSAKKSPSLAASITLLDRKPDHIITERIIKVYHTILKKSILPCGITKSLVKLNALPPLLKLLAFP